MSYAFDQPIEISDVDLAFPTSVSQMQPQYHDIPERYKNGYHPTVKFQKKWFFQGLSQEDMENLEFREGVDGPAAFRHLSYCQKSWDSKHEHKEAAVAIPILGSFPLR